MDLTVNKKSQRRPISKKLRFEVFKRDRFVCQYCGAHPPSVILEPDHINPVCNGGGNNIENLITSCFDCNRGKAGNLLTVIPKSLKQKSAEISEREDQINGYREVIQLQLDRIESDMWVVADTLIPKASVDGMRRDWLQSIKTFNARLERHLVIDAAEIAFSKYPFSIKNRFPYFCGICWNRIKEAN